MIEDEFVNVYLHRSEVERVMREASRQCRMLFSDATQTEKHAPKTARNAKYVAEKRRLGSLFGGTADQCKLALASLDSPPETTP